MHPFKVNFFINLFYYIYRSEIYYFMCYKEGVIISPTDAQLNRMINKYIHPGLKFEMYRVISKYDSDYSNPLTCYYQECNRCTAMKQLVEKVYEGLKQYIKQIEEN